MQLGLRDYLRRKHRLPFSCFKWDANSKAYRVFILNFDSFFSCREIRKCRICSTVGPIYRATLWFIMCFVDRFIPVLECDFALRWARYRCILMKAWINWLASIMMLSLSLCCFVLSSTVTRNSSKIARWFNTYVFCTVTSSALPFRQMSL